jgi:hypothetical protein
MACANCLAIKEKMHLCERCRVTWYCSSECQKAHWKQHKIECDIPLSPGLKREVRYLSTVPQFGQVLELLEYMTFRNMKHTQSHLTVLQPGSFVQVCPGVSEDARGFLLQQLVPWEKMASEFEAPSYNRKFLYVATDRSTDQEEKQDWTGCFYVAPPERNLFEGEHFQALVRSFQPRLKQFYKGRMLVVCDPQKGVNLDECTSIYKV